MTLFGLLWMLVAGIFFLHPNIRYMLAFTVLGMTLQCDNVFVIAGQGVGPQIITSALFVLKVFLSNGCVIKIPRNRNKLLYRSMALLLLVIVGSTALNGILTEKLLSLIQLIIYALCFYTMSSISYLLSEKFIYKLLKGLIVFLLFMGVVQLLITNNIIPRLEIVAQLFYNDRSGYVYYHYNNFKRAMSTFQEPSFYASIIVGAFFYILERCERRKNIILLIIVIQIILTFSSTAYATFCLVFALYTVTSDMPIKKKVLIVSACFLLVGVMYVGFYNVLDEVLFSKSMSGSANTRYYWNLGAIQAYETSPIYGHGYKSVRASSIIYTVLAETGIVGLACYLVMIFSIVKCLFAKDYKNEKGKKAIVFCVIAGILTQVIACPDLDLCTFWLCMYFYGLYTNPRKQNLAMKA